MFDDANKNVLIERYLLGELSGELLQTFNEKMATDEAFQKEVTLEKAIVRGLKTAGRKEWALKLKSLHQEMDQDEIDNSGHTGNITDEEYNRRLGRPETPVERTYTAEPAGKMVPLHKSRNLWLVAASIALLAVCTFAIVSNLSKDTDTLYQAYYQTYAEYPVLRGSTDLTALEKEAFTAYNQQNYPRSIELFKQVLAAKKSETALFYLGQAYMEVQGYDNAISTFELYLREYQELEIPAKWYLGLSYLKVDKPEEATTYLKDVAATPDTDPEAREYAAKAQELLDELD